MMEFLNNYWETLWGRLQQPQYWIYYVAVFLISALVLYCVGYSRKFTKKNVLLNFAGLLGFLVTTTILGPLVSLLENNLTWTISFFCVVLWLWFVSGNTFKEVLFAVAVGFCYEYIFSRLLVLIYLYFPPTWDYSLRVLVRDLSRTGLYVMMLVSGFFLFKRFIPKNQGIHLKHELWISILVIVLVVSTLESAMIATDIKGMVLAIFLQIAFAVTLLFVLFSFTKRRLLEREKGRMDRAIIEQNEHYSQVKQYVELMNIKYHDFKQNINYAVEAGKIDEQGAKIMLEIVEGFAGLELKSNINTLINDKLLLCERRDINCSYTIEEHCFDTLEWTDTVALINNIFYNAIEHVSLYENKDNRIISFKSYTKNGFLLVQCENYCESSPNFADGLPITTKEDAAHHGYGLKSIRYIVEKYHGSLTIVVHEKEKLFKVHVLIPIN